MQWTIRMLWHIDWIDLFVRIVLIGGFAVCSILLLKEFIDDFRR